MLAQQIKTPVTEFGSRIYMVEGEEPTLAACFLTSCVMWHLHLPNNQVNK